MAWYQLVTDNYWNQWWFSLLSHTHVWVTEPHRTRRWSLYATVFDVFVSNNVFPSDLFSAKPLTLSSWTYCQLNPNEHTLVNFDQYKRFLIAKMHLKLPSGNDNHVIQTLIWKHLWQAAAEKCAIFWRSILIRSIIHTKCDLVTGLSYMI